MSSQEATCQRWQFTYGVCPEHEPHHSEDWRAYAAKWLRERGVQGDLAILAEGPSFKHPEINDRMEIIDLSR